MRNDGLRNDDLFCRDESRRELDRRTGWNGIDWIEVSHDQLRLCIHFLLEPPQDLVPANFVIKGGVSVKDVRVTRVVGLRGDKTDPCLQVEVDKPGDLSEYELCIVALDDEGQPTSEPYKGFDPFYTCAPLSFRMNCPSELDCRDDSACPPPVRREPDIDYLAKDFATFRQLMLDRLALVMPEWRERHLPDVGIAIIEVMAYVADYLSYYQDAVATEAYLDTARLRISVRRHARLVDYLMHEGSNARAWMALETSADQELEAARMSFLTAWDNSPVTGTPLADEDLENIPADRYLSFQPLLPSPAVRLLVAHNSIAIYTWRNEQCCLEQGATSATLVDEWGEEEPPQQPAPSHYQQYKHCKPDEPPKPPRKRKLQLKPGDFLLFDELICATTGAAGDRTRKHVVRLTKVTQSIDPVTEQPIVEVEWSAEDALPFPMCISAIGPPPDCALLTGLTVARANVVLAEHGRRVVESIGIVPAADTSARCDGEGELDERILRAARFRPILGRTPVSFREAPSPNAPASMLLTQNPRAAVPRVSLAAIPPAPRDAVYEPEDLDDPQPLAARIKRGEDRNARLLRRHLSSETIELLNSWDGNSGLPAETKGEFIQDLRRLAIEGVQPEPLFDVDDLDDPTGLAFRLKQALDSGAKTMAARLGDEERELLDAFNGNLSDELHEVLAGLMNGYLETWTPQTDLLSSTSSDAHFVVEVDDDGRAHLRFGDDDCGREPEPGTAFIATYFTGNGTAGNIGAESLTRLLISGQSFDGLMIHVTNPLGAAGGTPPEPVAEVKAYAPRAFRIQRQRAVTADDYAELAGYDRTSRRDREIQKAAAQLAWNGSWPVASVSIDPAGGRSFAVSAAQDDTGVFAAQGDTLSMRDRVAALLHRYRRMGHDLAVNEGQYVPLELELHVCALPHYPRAEVRRELLAAFAKFFHPDNLSFGDAVYVSRIVATAQQVPGVASVEVKALRRLISKSNPDFDDGLLRLGPLEIPRLDNDPIAPHNGLLRIEMGGGR